MSRWPFSRVIIFYNDKEQHQLQSDGEGKRYTVQREKFAEENFAILRSNKHFAVLISQFVCWYFAFVFQYFAFLSS